MKPQRRVSASSKQPYAKKPPTAPKKNRGYVALAKKYDENSKPSLPTLMDISELNAHRKLATETPRFFGGSITSPLFILVDDYVQEKRGKNGKRSKEPEPASMVVSQQVLPLRLAVTSPHTLFYQPSRFNGEDNQPLTMQLPLGQNIDDENLKALISESLKHEVCELLVNDDDVVALCSHHGWNITVDELVRNWNDQIRVDEDGVAQLRIKWVGTNEQGFKGVLYDFTDGATKETNGEPSLLHPENLVGQENAVEGSWNARYYLRPEEKTCGFTWEARCFKASTSENAPSRVNKEQRSPTCPFTD